MTKWTTATFGWVVLLLFWMVAAACTNPDETDASHDIGPGMEMLDADGMMHRAPPPPLVQPPPSFEVVLADPPPTPLYGGSLEVSRDGTIAIAADPDRDRVWVIDLERRRLSRTVVLEEGAEPWRIAEDGAGRFHVSLRGSGDLLSLDRGKWLLRRSVCAEPRGLAAVGGRVHVACAEGRLVTLEAAGGSTPVRVIELEPDLRDVVVDRSDPTVLYVSRFRAAEVLVLDGEGGIRRRLTPHQPSFLGEPTTTVGVAYRMRAVGDGGVLVLHQHANTEAARAAVGGYGSAECGGSVVETVLSFLTPFSSDPPGRGARFEDTAFAIDFVLTGDDIYLLSPGSLPRDGSLPSHHQVRVATAGSAIGAGGCIATAVLDRLDVDALLTSVAAPLDGAPLFLAHEVPTLMQRHRVLLELPGPVRHDDGFALFHQRPGGAQIACASCHPEGGDDGATWRVSGAARRTQSLRGSITDNLPLHWDGNVPNFVELVHDATMRMDAPPQHTELIRALARYVDAIPHLRPPSDVPAALLTGGRALFESAAVGCAACHVGERLSNDETVNVGTDRAFQVPSLVGLRYRAPYLHDGRAASIRDVLTTEHTEGHGEVAHLSADEIDAIALYLSSL